MTMNLRIGFVINPLAGIGGAVALKGSDSSEIVKKALAKGAECKATERARVMLGNLPKKNDIQWLSAPGIMGGDALQQCGYTPKIVGELNCQPTSSADTQKFVRTLIDEQIDLLLFVGGDGTARDIYDVIADLNMKTQQLVLGIPAGVKMHSGVYAISPQAAARVVGEFLQKKAVSVAIQEVRDINEDDLRQGKINATYYGELLSPNDERYVQQVKSSGEIDDTMMQVEIAAGIVDDMDNETLYIVGAGTTPKAVMDELQLEGTLLGVDVILGRELIACDCDSATLLSLIDQYPYHPVKIILTATGNQGHIIGRGNQQLSATLLKKIGKDNLQVLITPNKLSHLNGRPLLMDSGNPNLDAEWSGWIKIYTGYRQQSVYPLSCGND